MANTKKNILAVNGGSSSIKFALYSMEGSPVKRLSGKIDRIGLPGAKLTFKSNRKDSITHGAASGVAHGGDSKAAEGEVEVKAADIAAAAAFLLDWLKEREGEDTLAAVGHRVVHGMQHRESSIVDPALLEDLQRISVYDPDHLPGEIALIKLFAQRASHLPQVVCFDTAFHASLPRLARLLPIPRRFDAAGIQRYGFHGLSYTYVLEELTHVAGPLVASGLVVMAHLGNGASLVAVKDGQPLDTTMGFTPTGGVMMGTRPGDLDPGVIGYMLQKEKMTAAQLDHLVNHEAGLLGVSETSSDMQDLLGRESTDIRAAEAVALFCYQVRKTIGAYSAVLGGLDALVFTGGIGEKSSVIRSRICAGLEYLGIEIDQRPNEANEKKIGVAGGRVGIYVIPTDEEWVIARSVYRLLKNTPIQINK